MINCIKYNLMTEFLFSLHLSHVFYSENIYKTPVVCQAVLDAWHA